MASPNKWFNVSAAKAGRTEVALYEEIGSFGASAAELITELQAIPPENHIDLRINSGGGSIVDGLAIIAALKRHAGGVTAWIDGIAASMAGAIACAMDKTYIAEGAFLMVHRASTVAAGDADELRAESALLERFEDGIISIYQNKTGLPEDEIRGYLDPETWFSSMDAMALGFVDALSPASYATAKMSLGDAKARLKKIMQKDTPETVEVKADATPEAVAEVLETSSVEACNHAAEIEALREENESLRSLMESVKVTNDEAVNALTAKLSSLVKSGGLVSSEEVPAVAAAEDFDPVAAFKAASESGDSKLRDSIYAAHRDALWSSR